MKFGRLIAAAVVLAALAGALYWSNHHTPVEDAAKAAASAPPKIVSVNTDEITKLEIKKKDADNIVLDRNGNEKWKIVEPKKVFADQDPISTILTNLSPLNADRVVEDKASDLKPYGLADPEVVVTATSKDGKSQKLLVGDDTPAGGDAFAMLDGDPRVFTISGSFKTSFDKDLKDLRDKHLLPVDFNLVKDVEINGPKLHLAFDSENGQWVTQSPKNFRGDTSAFEGVVEKLRSATMDTSTSDADMKKAAAEFSSGTPVATIKATDSSGTQELQIRKNKTDYYAKPTAMDGEYKISSDLGDAVNKGMDDFLEKRVFDFAADTPDKIEMHDGAKDYSFSRTGDDWFSSGKKLDAVTFEDFLRTVRELTATKFANSGLSSPTTSLTVTSNDGKRVEKVQIAKSGSDYVAKREDAPQLYELASSAIDDMRKAADGVKPAEEPPAKK